MDRILRLFDRRHIVLGRVSGVVTAADAERVGVCSDTEGDGGESERRSERASAGSPHIARVHSLSQSGQLTKDTHCLPSVVSLDPANIASLK